MDANEFREAGHRVVDLLADYQETVEDRPLFPEVEPERLRALFDEPPPREEMSMAAVLDELDRKLFPYCTHVNHPGYFGLITPTSTPAGTLGDFIASALNQNVGTFTIGPSAVAMERRTVGWLCELAGYGAGAGGNLTSGGTMANTIGLKLARDFASADRAQHDGVNERWGAYVSEERHVSVDKSADVVGIGRNGLRIVPLDGRFRIDLDALEERIAQDKEQGIRPMCVIGIAGTTNTGAVDPIPALRKIADREGAWLHVDAAYGGGVLLSRKRDLLRDLRLADSITLDPHKWFYAPLDAGAILVRDEARLTRSFGLKPSYLTDELDAAGERYQYYVHGFEQSRRFRSLKVWMSFKRYGLQKIGAWIDANIDQAHRLYELCRESSDFEAASEPPMSAVCIRYLAPEVAGERLTRLHHEVARRVEAGGRFWISTTQLKGRFWFRINPVNFRTRLEHMDELLALLREECRNVLAETERGSA